MTVWYYDKTMTLWQYEKSDCETMTRQCECETLTLWLESTTLWYLWSELRLAEWQETAGGGDDGGQPGVEPHHGPPSLPRLGSLHSRAERHEVGKNNHFTREQQHATDADLGKSLTDSGLQTSLPIWSFSINGQQFQFQFQSEKTF